VANSIKEFGFKVPIIIDANGVIVTGHTRYKAAKKLGMETVPCILADDLTDEQVKAFRLADNKVAEIADWDFELLDDELSQVLDIDMEEFGFEFDALSDNSADVIEDEPPEPPKEPRTKLGDMYKLGGHRLICGDSTDIAVIDRLMDGVKADMVFTDPPYGMKKESEGVLNDNLNYDDLLDFNRQWIPLTFGALKDNGSWYCWGIDEPLMDIYSNILKPMQKENKITFRNLITWDKGDAGAGGVSFMGKDGLRSYPVGSEKCLFVMCGVQGFNNNQDNYFEGWEPVRQYLVGEAEKVGLTSQKLKEICGVNMWSHWFGKSQFAFITEEHYKELQDYYNKKEYDAFKKEYDELKKEYDELKKEYYSTRAYFDNTHDTMTDVWAMGRISHEEKMQAGGHATPKPLALCQRAIKSSSRENESVLDLFGGSGSTLIACEQLGRKCYMMELDPHYCDVIRKRYWKFKTGSEEGWENGTKATN
jgi:DNA modification methylase